MTADNRDTERNQEARATREAAQNEYRFRGADRVLCGTADWYIVCTVRGTVKQMRERDILDPDKGRDVVGTLGGPYFTKSQARDESFGYRLSDYKEGK
jgi:hypothetical protein